MDINKEIKLIEQNLAAIRSYIDNFSLEGLTDRLQHNGKKYLVVCTIEDQIKHFQSVLQQYLEMVERLHKLRENYNGS